MIKRRSVLKSLSGGLVGAAFVAPNLVAPNLVTNAEAAEQFELRGTGDLGVIIERASGSVQIIETTTHTSLARISGLGDLSHASIVFSRDQRYAFVFGRDGALSKIDMLTFKLVKRVIQAGNAIGGAISDDGKLLAVSNYQPGGVNIFKSESLELVASIAAGYGSGEDLSKTVGLVDAPGGRFVFSLYDAGQIWIADCSKCLEGAAPEITKLTDIGLQPYDGLISGDGRYYIAGLFGEDGMVLVDLWADKPVARRILDGYGRGEKNLPVYKMPHLEGWAEASGAFYLPAVGHHEVLGVEAGSFNQKKSIKVHGQPVFVMARSDGRQIWVNFAHPRNDTLQIIDVPTGKIIKQLKPGKAVLHMEFTPRGEQVWVSVRDENRIDIFDTRTFQLIASLPADAPSGIFFTWRAGRIGL